MCFFFFFFKQKTAYEMLRSLVGSEMCIRDRYNAYVNKHGIELMACNDKMQRYETATKHATNELQRNSEKLATDLKTCNAKLKDIKEISEKRILQNETLNKD